MEAAISQSRPAAVEILDVSIPELDREHLSHFGLLSPQPGVQETNPVGRYAMDVDGRVLGRDERVIAVDLMVDDITVQRILLNTIDPALAKLHPDTPNHNRHGFYKRVSALKLTPTFEFTIEALLKDQETRVKLADLRGTRPVLPQGSDTLFQPLMITTLGRSGSTAIINLLASHPQIVAYRPTETETRIASYWMDVFMTLADPSSSHRQIYPRGLARNWWLGDAHVTPRLDDDPETREWLGLDAVEDLAAFSQGRIDAFYRQLAPRVGRPDALYFVEKCQPRVGNALPALLGELYPRAREVVLVRDFRDMMSSMLSYKNGTAFAPPAGSTWKEHTASLGKSAFNLLQNWQRRAGEAHLVRYEDLVRDPHRTIKDLLLYLHLDAGTSTVDALAGFLSQSAQTLKQHRTTVAPDASIGRWRTDLGPRRQMVEEAFAPALEGFGYSL